jgi:uncharacterized protein YndB with AHSA1/START domain
MIEPLVVEFDVDAAPAHAFDTWTSRCGLWWPRGHTICGAPAAITFEPFAGGRIFERAADGTEHDWGKVLDWEPPTRLRYRWHLFFDPVQATEVEVTFTAHDARTLVRIEQTGWDQLGEAGPPRRSRTQQGWGAITTAFARSLVSPR